MNLVRYHSRRLLLYQDAALIPRPRPLSPPPPPFNATTTTTENNSTTTRPPRPGFVFDSSMALTILVLLTALFFMGFFSIYIARFSNANTADLTRRRRLRHRAPWRASHSGVDPVTVQSLPLFAYDGDAKEPLDCVVCLSEFQERETVKMIPHCGHVFHPQCIDMWLSSHDSCPLCRSTKFLPAKETRLQISDEGLGGGGGGGGGAGPYVAVSGFQVGPTDGASVEREAEEGPPCGMRRTSSCCCNLGERALLQRSSSF